MPCSRPQAQVLAGGCLAVGAAALGDHADRAPHPRRLGANVIPRDPRRALVRPRQRGEDAHRGRLAGAVRAEQAEDRALLDGERQTVERPDVTRIFLDEALRLYRNACHW
jgi:hypothetical protein